MSLKSLKLHYELPNPAICTTTSSSSSSPDRKTGALGPNPNTSICTLEYDIGEVAPLLMVKFKGVLLET